ncbi:MAG: putative hydrolase [uncultured marine phage]|uniref:Putative hydrolase n=1 Tax=uncultured marine phage TaxID=707152 RepID=A0A8D9CCC1_9VIRU|nr:MAG: putative hydrolase [uncultured marine phage]
MRLIRIYEFLDTSAMKELKKAKRDHSKRVADLTKQLSNSEDIYNAAYYHDYLERSGNREKMGEVLSFYSHTLVILLTNKEGEDALHSLKKKLKGSNKKIKDDTIIIKTCDRIDNLLKRKREGKLTKKYIRKSADLFKYMYNNYSRQKQLKKFIKKNLLSEMPELRRFIKFK